MIPIQKEFNVVLQTLKNFYWDQILKEISFIVL